MLKLEMIPTYSFPELVFETVRSIEIEEQDAEEVYRLLNHHSEARDKEIANALQIGDVELFDRLKGDRTKLHDLKKLVGYYVKADTGEKENDKNYYQYFMGRVNDNDCYKLYWVMTQKKAQSPVAQALSLIENATLVTDISEVYQARDILREYVTKEI